MCSAGGVRFQGPERNATTWSWQPAEAQCIVLQLGNASHRAKSRSSSRFTNCTGKLISKYSIACSVPCLVRSKPINATPSSSITLCTSVIVGTGPPSFAKSSSRRSNSNLTWAAVIIDDSSPFVAQAAALTARHHGRLCHRVRSCRPESKCHQCRDATCIGVSVVDLTAHRHEVAALVLTAIRPLALVGEFLCGLFELGCKPQLTLPRHHANGFSYRLGQHVVGEPS